MPLFKATVAQEACPAKTAETISYGATFAVLGWLLVSNYAGLENTERNTLPLTGSTPLLAANTNAAESGLVPIAGTLTRTTSKPVEIARYQTEANAETQLALAPIWHKNIEHFQGLESHIEYRAFSASDWTYPTSDQQTVGLLGGISLSRPEIESDLLFADFLVSAPDDLSGNQVAEADLISEITIKGEATDRLNNRADKIQRPQIPRPYSAQRIQRSFVLPPRIQALRP